MTSAIGVCAGARTAEIEARAIEVAVTPEAQSIVPISRTPPNDLTWFDLWYFGSVYYPIQPANLGPPLEPMVPVAG